MQNKKVLVFLAKGFETMEFSVFIDVLGWAGNDFGHKIIVDTCGFNDRVISTFNVPVIVDKTIGEICTDDYDALAIPGGTMEFGFYEEAYDERLLKLNQIAIQQMKIMVQDRTGRILGDGSKKTSEL